MKKFIILLTLLLSMWSCTVTEKPQFVGLENIKVLESNSKYITFGADAYFMNPNDLGGTLKTDEIKVYINDNEVAQISTESFDVPAKNEFSIPLKTKIPTDSLFSNKNIGSLVGSLFSKSVKVQYKGDIKYLFLGFSYDYEIDKTENIKIKI
ncbi:hypothetical protein VOI54_11620 [Tamlana sp. 2201CG12-4]|uniref:hypothetical protein n=1 Tax=Tamlana sp. 2201CG12-4 TaxID=3112582 RepID=UPI002DB9DBEC|nr:hypothetical protein [Tamlana sp. 2201CG12-4]MEC3907669.1 hypothetical protein [Tamlana sp. 2201CG12-4]